MKPFQKQRIPALLCAAAMTVTLPLGAAAADNDPAITGEMSDPDYWASRYSEPLTPMASCEELASLNEQSRSAEGTGLRDLSGWTETDYNGVEWARQRREEAMELADHLYNDCDARYDAQGTLYRRWTDALEQFFAPMIENCRDTDATIGEHELYAICTTATSLHSFPSDEPILTQSGGEGIDYQRRSDVLLGEPLILKGESEDGKFVYAYTSCDSGWMSWQDLAVCYDREGWLRAWQFESDNTLVVYGDGVRTQALEEDDEGSNQSLHMGTWLQLASPEDYQDRFHFDSARGEYVVWLPLRSQSGWYDAQLAVVNRSSDANQGFLKLNSANLAAVALKQPKDVYRWNEEGMQDCTGYARRVYRCFGLELAPIMWSVSKQPLRQYSLKGKSDAEKTAALKKLPLGTLLRVRGKELFYLGHVGDRLYVISSSDVQTKDSDELHSTVLDTMDTLVSDGTTLLNNLTLAVVPYYVREPRSLEGAKVSGIKIASYTGEQIEQKLKVEVDGVTLLEGVHYTLSYSDNVEVGEATVSIRGKGNWTGTLRERFAIRPVSTKLTQVSAGEGSFTAKWEKRDGVKGYQVQYSRRRSFSQAEKVTVKGRKSTTQRVSELPSGSTLYVRVRTYTRVNGKMFASAWSRPVSVTIQ